MSEPIHPLRWIIPVAIIAFGSFCLGFTVGAWYALRPVAKVDQGESFHATGPWRTLGDAVRRG